MGEPPSASQARLQRLQRQRQRVNERKARNSSRAVAKRVAEESTQRDEQSAGAANIIMEADDRVANNIMSGGNRASNTCGNNISSAPHRGEKSQTPVHSNQSRRNMQPLNDDYLMSSPSLSSPRAPFNNQGKIRSNISSALTQPQHSAADKNSPQRTHSSRIIDGEDGSGVEIVAASPSQKRNPPPDPPVRPPQPQASSPKASSTKAASPKSTKAASPKSLAVSKSIAESRRLSRKKPTPSVPVLSEDQSSSKDSWFQYTNGTHGGSVSSTPKRNNVSSNKSNQLQQRVSNDESLATTNVTRKSPPSSSCSLPSDEEETSKEKVTDRVSETSAVDDSPSRNNMWKAMPKVNSNIYNKSTLPPPMPSTNDAGSANKPTQQNFISKPLSKVGSAVNISSTDQKNTTNNKINSKSNRTISIRHGGTPVWIHSSIIRDNNGDGDEGVLATSTKQWEWVRGYLHAASSDDDSMAVTVDDPNSSPNLNGNTFTISKKYNDGKHILMGNAWWSIEGSSSSSPTSISQPLGVKASDTDTHMPPEDLVEMTHLHEPAIVHALQTRYEQDIIYTNTGHILLAVNPFKKLDHLYTREMMELYWRAASEENGSRPPHAYAVAEHAYSSMLHSLERRDDYHLEHPHADLATKTELPPCCQSILVSGESGAGKTVTTKIIMRYLSILSQRHSDDKNNAARQNGHPSVEMQVLQSNPILESFGNARTIRNDNSSRFGKFIEMSFQARKGHTSGGQRGSLLGATIDFYLLEKVRLVSVAPGERTYHIFYELLSPHGMNVNDKRRYKLSSCFGNGSTPSTVEDFNITSISGTFDRRDGVDDSVTYRELRTAMQTVGFTADEQDSIYSVVSALLHASNLTFVNNGSDESLVYAQDGTLEAVSSLLGVSEDSLKMSLTTSILEARGEILTKRLSLSQAEKALEATAKAIYAALFAYIVKRINKSIEVHGKGQNINDRSDDVATIGVLDIFGFESFENNSFEQLCINYCNEALQQQFNRFVFKAEQTEYENEGIVWSHIDFPDNQEALDLIEAKRSGIFSVLDEQCRLPRRTDQTFAKAVYDTCESSYFSASQMQKSKGRFVILHYAGKVEYNSDSFILKNKDELPKSASDLLASSKVPLISKLATILSAHDASPPSPLGNGGHAPMKRSSSTLTRTTVSGQFASQLKGLRSRIETTEPHYIRCLKPNDCLVANQFDESLIAHQLNCAGVVPAMKIARAGFAMRYLHTAFIQHYRPIVVQEMSRRLRKLSGHQLTCQHLISLLSTRLESEMKQRSQPSTKIGDIVSWGVQVGKSKVFLRTSAFEALEELRNSTMNEAAIVVQAQARTFLCQNKFYLILGSVLTLQCAARKLIATIYVHRLRSERSSITIQKQWRSYYAWSLYQNVLYITTWCQRFWRGGKVREKCTEIKQYRSAIVIQSAWRSHVFKQCHQEVRNCAIIIQCLFRVSTAKRILQSKRDAKGDMQSIAMERDKLRVEMRQMKRELEQAKTRQHYNTIEQSDSWSARTSASQEEKIRVLAKELSKKDYELQMLRRMVDSLRGSGRSLPSTLPLTVSIHTASPPSRPGLSLLPSGESSLTSRPPAMLNSPSLLDSEVEDVPHLECTQISLPDSSVEEMVNTSALNQTITEASFIDCIKIDELPFHQAVQNDDKDALLQEIQNSSDIELGINSADSRGRTPLHIAALCSNSELAKILLSHYAVANTQDFSGNTALHYADSSEMTRILLEGGISPNIPNGNGLCALHLAVKRRGFVSVKELLSHGANVNNADDDFWYTSLHLVAHAESPLANASRSLRGPIAELLCEAKAPSIADLNYQDRDGNTPLHHAASLVEEDAGILISLFIEHGSSPKIANHRGQTPVHLFCHNHAARQFVFYHEALHLMLVKGADPNKASSSGCTALHLALYHQDVQAAALLVRHGAQVNTKWKKPQKWEASWTDMGSDDVFPLDMLDQNVQSLSVVLSEISTPQDPAPRRLRCMHCKVKFRMFARHHNCTHCGRSVCGKCCVGSLSQSYFTTLGNADGSKLFKVCTLCEPILLSTMMNRVPKNISCDQSSIGTISFT